MWAEMWGHLWMSVHVCLCVLGVRKGGDSREACVSMCMCLGMGCIVWHELEEGLPV